MADVSGLDLQEREAPAPRRLATRTRRFITVAAVVTAVYASVLGLLAASIALGEPELFTGHEALVLTLMAPVGFLLQLVGGVGGAFTSVAIGPASGSLLASSIMFIGGAATGIGQGALVSGILYLAVRLVRGARDRGVTRHRSGRSRVSLW